MSRRSLDETRTLLLETAAEMLTESEARVTIGKVDLTEVSRRAGLESAGSAYKIWGTQDAYRTSLLHHILTETPSRDEIDALTRAIAEEPAELPPLHELICDVVAASTLEAAAQLQEYSLYVALWLAALSDRKLAEQLHDADIALLDAQAALYERVLISYGLEFVPPVDAHLFATMVSALAEGLTMESATQPTVVNRPLQGRLAGDDQERSWPVLACGVMALIDASTRPVAGTRP